MKFVMFTAVQDDGRMPVAISPSRAQAVIAAVGRDGQRMPDVSAILIDGPCATIDVAGTVAEVVAALEAATTPPAPAPVVVEPSDLEIAAKVLDEVARVAISGASSFEPDVGAIDRALGLDSFEWEDTADALTAIASRLRGLAR